MNSLMVIGALFGYMMLLTCTLGAPATGSRHGIRSIDLSNCSELSIELNKKARNISKMVQPGNVSCTFEDPPARIENRDNCDPDHLKDNKETCLAKIITGLKNYSVIFGERGLFTETQWKGLANEVAAVAKKLLTALNEHPSQPQTQMWTQQWEREGLRPNAVERLFSFSIVTARVFSFLKEEL